MYCILNRIIFFLFLLIINSSCWSVNVLVWPEILEENGTPRNWGHVSICTDKYYISLWPNGDVSELGLGRVLVEGINASLHLHQDYDHREVNINESEKKKPIIYEFHDVDADVINKMFEHMLYYNGVNPSKVSRSVIEPLVYKWQSGKDEPEFREVSAGDLLSKDLAHSKYSLLGVGYDKTEGCVRNQSCTTLALNLLMHAHVPPSGNQSLLDIVRYKCVIAEPTYNVSYLDVAEGTGWGGVGGGVTGLFVCGAASLIFPPAAPYFMYGLGTSIVAGGVAGGKYVYEKGKTIWYEYVVVGAIYGGAIGTYNMRIDPDMNMPLAFITDRCVRVPKFRELIEAAGARPQGEGSNSSFPTPKEIKINVNSIISSKKPSKNLKFSENKIHILQNELGFIFPWLKRNLALNTDFLRVLPISKNNLNIDYIAKSSFFRHHPLISYKKAPIPNHYNDLANASLSLANEGSFSSGFSLLDKIENNILINIFVLKNLLHRM